MHILTAGYIWFYYNDMSRLQQFSASLLLMLFGFTNILPLAYAQTVENPTSTIAVSPTGPSRRVQAICKVATNRISRIITNSGQHLTNRQNYVTQKKAKLDSDLAQLTAKSIDITTLQADADHLKGLLDTWVTDFQTYIQDLKDTQQFTCGNSDGQFKAAVEKAKAQQKTLKADDKAIREYYNKTYRVDFRTALKTFRQKIVQERIDAAKKKAEERKEELQKRLEERKDALKKQLEERKNRRGGTGTSVTPTSEVTPVPTE